MIDFNEMVSRQHEGIEQVESLEQVEKDVLQHFCSLAAEEILKMAHERGAPRNEVAVNAFKNGVALGIRLTIVNGEVRGRK